MSQQKGSVETDLFAVIDATWPAAQLSQRGAFTLRQGQGGGSRVSAATARGIPRSEDIKVAESDMRGMHQKPLFMIRPGDDDLDHQLAARGYEIVDPVVIYACPTRHLTDRKIPRVTVFTIWEPLAIMREIWETGGIGPARIAVMGRAAGAKTGFFARHREKPAGVAFAAIRNDTAMVHAVEIAPHQRRQGMGAWIMRGAAFWAAAQGATTLTVMCTRANRGANALYASLGMAVVGQYHYRHLPSEPEPT